MSEAVKGLLSDVQTVSPQVADVQEVAALIESFGHNDRFAQECGFSDVFCLAQHLFLCLPQGSVEDRRPAKWNFPVDLRTEAVSAARKFSLSLAYSIPWMALLVLEYLRPTALQVSPEFGGALGLSLIASLITTGGFIQMIFRRGGFYFGLKEPFLARRWCMLLLKLGLASNLVCMLVGVTLGIYFGLFSAGYLFLAAINYLTLSLLWMLCAVLSVEGIGWCIPIVFFLSALTVAVISLLFNFGTTLILVLCPLTGAIVAGLCVVLGFRRQEIQPNKITSAPPRFGVTLTSLLPFYAYGTLYFSFLFADRLAAGSAIPWTSGLSFGIDPAYKKGMDLVLLAFLITAALVEYLSDTFLRFWSQLAAALPQDESDYLVARLQHRRRTMMATIVVFFIAVATLAWFLFSRSYGSSPSLKLLETVVLGGLGYLLLAIALFENIILAGMNATPWALRAVALGLVANVLAGYCLSHLWGVQFAAAGLFLGSVVLFWQSSMAVRRVIHDPGYHYSVA
jgi:hypothetical protein